MARVVYYLTVAILITILLQVVGFQSEQQGVLSILGVSNISQGDGDYNYNSDSSFLAELLGILNSLKGAAVGGLVIGFLISRNENFIMVVFISAVLIAFIGSFTSIILLSGVYDNYIKIPALIIGLVFTSGFVVTLFEFARGNV